MKCTRDTRCPSACEQARRFRDVSERFFRLAQSKGGMRSVL